MNVLGTEKHVIIHSDVIIALNNQIPDNSIDLIFADPPYNNRKELCWM